MDNIFLVKNVPALIERRSYLDLVVEDALDMFGSVEVHHNITLVTHGSPSASVVEHMQAPQKLYKVNDELIWFDLAQIYPVKFACPDGMCDALFSRLEVFNRKTREKRVYEGPFDIYDVHEVAVSQIFPHVDGGIVITFSQPTRVSFTHLCSPVFTS